MASFLKKYYAFLSRRCLAGVYEPFYLSIYSLIRDFLLRRNPGANSSEKLGPMGRLFTVSRG
jgi:hypothetical protein